MKAGALWKIAKGFGSGSLHEKHGPSPSAGGKIRHVRNLAERGWVVLCFALNASNFTSE